MKERIINGIIAGTSCLFLCVLWALWFTEISEFLIDYVTAFSVAMTLGAFCGGLALNQRKRIYAAVLGLLFPLILGLILYIAYPIEF